MPRATGNTHAKPSAGGQSGRIDSVADLARHLNLSAWTVSRAINGHAGVKERTRQRIQAAMQELGFQPNPFARGLRGRRTGLVGVCFAGLGSPILNSKLYHLQEFLRRHQLRSLMEVSLRDPLDEARVVEDLLRIRVEGIVLIYSGLRADTARSLLKGTACVFVDPHEAQQLPSISLDRRRAMHLLLDHLLQLGHRTFGLLGIGLHEAWRWPALAELACQRSLDPARAFFLLGDAPRGDQSIEAGREMARAALRLPQPPSALICVDDRVAVGAIQFLQSAGLRVPHDISVTGFDNLDLARQLQPTLTTIEQNPLQLMEGAGTLLLEQIGLPPAKRGRSRPLAVDPVLVLGESTGPACPRPARTGRPQRPARRSRH